MFDVNDESALEKLREWPEYIERLVKCPVILVGNKVDLDEEKRKIKRADAKEFSQKYGYDYIEAAGQTGQNLQEAFTKCFESILKAQEKKDAVIVLIDSKKETKPKNEVKKHSEDPEIIRVVIAGDQDTGKSSLMNRYADDAFSDTYSMTIGIDFKSKQVERDEQSYRFQIWDTAGAEKFKTITSSYYKGAGAFILVFDLTKIDSFKHLTDHLSEIDKYSNRELPLVIVGTKSDLKDRKISHEEAQAFAAANKMRYVEISSKTGNNVKEVFEQLLTRYIERKRYG